MTDKEHVNDETTSVDDARARRRAKAEADAARWHAERRRTRRRRCLVGGMVLAAAIGATAVVSYPRLADRWGWNCGDSIRSMSASDLDSVNDAEGLVAWSEMPDRSPRVDDVERSMPSRAEVEALPAELGSPLVGQIDLDRDGFRRYWENGEDTVMLSSGGSVLGVLNGDPRLVALDPTEGVPRWGLRFGATGSGGGTVEDIFVVIKRRDDGDLEVLGIDDATGARRSCARLAGADGWGVGLDSRHIVGHDVAVASELRTGHDLPAVEVTRLDVSTGGRAWSVRPELERLATLHANEEIVVVSSDHHGLSANYALDWHESDTTVVSVLDAATGETRWTITGTPTHAETALFLGPEGMVVTEAYDRDSDDVEGRYSLHAYSSSGEPMWTLTDRRPGTGEDRLIARQIDGVLIVENGADYLGLDPTTGEELWRTGVFLSPGPADPDGLLLTTIRASDVVDDVLVLWGLDFIGVLDPATGRLEVVGLPFHVDRVDAAGDGLIINGDWGAIVTTGADPASLRPSG
ncbi:MAG: PQQ-binding-like beta-propeller repeat protein [Desertimonas sp.]